MIASQKFGTDWPSSATPIASRSILPPRCVAASTPSGTASTIASSIAVTVSWKVAGKPRGDQRQRRLAVPQRDAEIAVDRADAGSASTARAAGRRTPTRRGTSAICSAVAPGGSMISAGSPVRKVRKNETTETPTMTRTRRRETAAM